MPRYEIEISVEMHVSKRARFIVEAADREAARDIAFNAIDCGYDAAVYPPETVDNRQPGEDMEWRLGAHWMENDEDIDVDVTPLDE